MDTYEAINSRRGVRDFKPQSLEPALIQKIIAAGLKAPSHNYLREWEFVVVQDQAARLNVIQKVQKEYTREGIEAWLDSWNAADPLQRATYLADVPKQYTMLLTAGCLILVFFKQTSPLLKPDSLSALNAFASIWGCIENMLIAASAEGVHGVTRIPFEPEIHHIKAVVGCPPDYELACYLALGYPADETAKNKRPPVKVEDKIHWNQW
jgi:nitroreductase